MSRHPSLIALAILAAAPAVHAQSGISCSSQISPGQLAFGNYSPLAAGGVSLLLGEVVVACTNSRSAPPETVRVRAAISAGSSGTVARRRMNSTPGGSTLAYNLYQDAAYTALWTDQLGGPGYTLIVPRGRSAQLRLPVFGRIPGGQSSARPAAYSDALVLTVRY
jgi:spore coat protein U-like protein